MPEGDDVSVEIETELGVTRCGGRTGLASFHLGNRGANGRNNQKSAALYPH